MLKKHLECCIDWSQVDKYAYLEAMRKSVADSTTLKQLLYPALTDRINDRETFMKGIDYSYYYEQEDWTFLHILLYILVPHQCVLAYL